MIHPLNNIFCLYEKIKEDFFPSLLLIWSYFTKESENCGGWDGTAGAVCHPLYLHRVPLRGAWGDWP